MILRKNAAHFRGRAVLVVGGGFNNDRSAARTIAFVNNLFETGGLDALAGATFDRALNVVVRHTLGARCLDRAPKAWIAVGISTAGFRSDGDFLRELAKDLAAFRVDRAFETLDL